jgi:hypothetical protein
MIRRDPEDGLAPESALGEGIAPDRGCFSLK